MKIATIGIDLLEFRVSALQKDNEISKTLKSDGEKNIDKLKDMSGSEFDKKLYQCRG